VWCPFASRAKRKRTFSGYTLGLDGELHVSEIKGPKTDDEWEACFEVFKTAAIMLSIANLEAMIRYQALIKKYHTAYGQVCWALLYQADSRMRCEQFEIILRRGEMQHAAAQLPNGQPSDFDPALRWDWVFQNAVETEQLFWTDEFERNAVLIRTKVDRLSDHLGTDANIDGQPAGKAHAVGERPTRVSTQSGADSHRGADRGSPRQEKAHNVKDGKYTTNRGNIDLCRNYQTGECKDTTTGRSGAPMCAKNRNLAHQCELCLGTHPSTPANGEPCSAGSERRGKGKRWQRKSRKGGQERRQGPLGLTPLPRRRCSNGRAFSQ
jgi:hypothetical protein